MGMDAVLPVMIGLAIICGAIWAGNRMVQKGIPAKGATGTLGSVLSMIEPATGAPTRMEAAAALEELRQRRHEHLSAGSGNIHDELLAGKIVLPSRSKSVWKGDAKI